jgi:predicted peroxiredoxin
LCIKVCKKALVSCPTGGEVMSKVAMVCNGSEPKNLYPAFVLGSSAAALGDEVLIFFTPRAGVALKKGELEKVKGKGLPDMADLLDAIEGLNVRFLLCELAMEAQDLREDEIREGVEIVGATLFMAEIRDARITFSF